MPNPLSPRRQVDPVSTSWLTPGELEAWRAFTLVIAKLPTALEQQLQSEAQLSYVEYYVLAGLSEQPDRAMRLTQLAMLTNAELSRLSHLVRRLEHRGFVQRQTDPVDRRATLAVLTDVGHAHLAAVAGHHVALVRELVVDSLGTAALRQLLEISTTILDNLEHRDHVMHKSATPASSVHPSCGTSVESVRGEGADGRSTSRNC